MDASFARPASQLADSGIANAAAPTGGMGLVLDSTGLLPPSVHPPILTTWPAAAVASGEVLPGYEFYYVADSSNGVYWHFKYDPTQATYPWVFLGGPPLYSEVTTSETRANTAYGALATAGPSIALPRAGDYDVAIGCVLTNNTANDGALMSYDIGGTGAVDVDSIQVGAVPAVNEPAPNVHRERRKTGLTAVTLTAKYKTATGGTGAFANRYMRATPVRLA